jgi:hypothetical protein
MVAKPSRIAFELVGIKSDKGKGRKNSLIAKTAKNSFALINS